MRLITLRGVGGVDNPVRSTMRNSVSAIGSLASDHGDRLLEENIALVGRLTLLRSVLEHSTNENADLRRQMARLRTENRRLRSELANRDLSPPRSAA